MIGHSGLHRWGNPQRLVNAAEIVAHEVQRNRVRVVINFLEKALVSRAKRRIFIRIVRFCRSTKLVEM